ncbi:MAG: zf-TFIIB domain-containing protein [Bdellovibrionaceae bacterium]|nr:zf-TFIIB domain-containing protein [Pseudobdellovibrionaceae bacterium]
MAACPNCHQAIEITDQHAGTLFTCPHCRAVFFVGWDGQPEAAAPAENDEVETPAFSGDQPVPFSFEPLPETPLPPEEAAVFGENPGGEETPAAPPDPDNFDQPIAPVSEESAAGFGVEPTSPAPSDLGSVVEYANASASTGPLRYILILRGLELASTVRELREALTDSRFGWDVDDIMAHLKNGELRLKPMNPTKASILVNRIKSLPIEVSWRQEVYGEVSS